MALLPLCCCLVLAACGGGQSVAADGTAMQEMTAAVAAPAAAADGVSSALAAAGAADTAVSQPPVVFNASGGGKAGDIVMLQGANFGSSPTVLLNESRTTLEVVNRSTDWLAVRLVAPVVRGPLSLRVRTTAGVSAPVALDAARPLHLDAVQLVPGGAFRVFGRHLVASGGKPAITIDGIAATVDLARSDDYMLTAVAPAGLAPTAAAAVLVDNGNGSGPARLDRMIEVVAAPAGGATDPYALGVGWAAAFAPLAANTIDAAADTRLSSRMVCDGARDDAPALQAAIELAAGGGGGVVKLPAGRCRLAGGMELRSRVVVQGAGKSATTLVYESNYPVFGYKVDLAGVRNLALVNAGGSGEGPLLKESSRVVLQNLRIDLGTSRQMYLDGNRHFAMTGNDIIQGGSISHQGPYILADSTGLVFENNTTRWLDGAPAFGRVHDSVIKGNRYTRDAANQNNGGTVHSLVLDFAHRVAVVGNTFDVANGPITNTGRNDGEALLTEGGGSGRTENLGTVAGAGSSTLSDPSNSINVDPFGTGAIPENYGVAVVSGRGAGQTRRVVGYANGTLTVDRAWDVVPEAGAHYATFVWGLEKALVKDNVFNQNPRGIWLYHTAVRDVDIVGNTLTEGGGIYLRSYQNLATRSFMPIYNVLVARNTVRNTTGRWMSYIASVFVNSDARAFGIATLGVEFRNNEIVANQPNVGSQTEEYANVEGFLNMMRVENYAGVESPTAPRLLGTLMTDNTCTHCSVAVRVGTGAGATTIVGTQLTDSAALIEDWATTGTGDKSVSTVIR